MNLRKKILLLISFSLILCSCKTSEFNVKGMMCGNGCVKKIEKEINMIEGIKEYNISFQKSNMIITYDSNLVNENIIIEALNNNTNYSCTLKEETNSFMSFFKNLF